MDDMDGHKRRWKDGEIIERQGGGKPFTLEHLRVRWQ